jgi:hypothetical protein
MLRNLFHCPTVKHTIRARVLTPIQASLGFSMPLKSMLIITLRSNNYYYSHFSDEGIEAQRR